MATTTQHAPGTFCWPELASIDQPGAKTFYTKLFGWSFKDQDMGNGEHYTMFQLKDRDVAALYTMRKEERDTGAPPHWNSYVSVASADETAAKAAKLGGTIVLPAFDVFDSGRMAFLQDPTGAMFGVWQAKNHHGVGALDEVGAMTWTELLTNDTGKAQSFYTGLFPWKAEAKPMGPMVYTLFLRGDAMAGGMMEITKEMGPIPPHWMVYFSVADCDATVAKVGALGGKVMLPPHEVPGIGRFSILQDPQGAHFAVIRLASAA